MAGNNSIQILRGNSQAAIDDMMSGNVLLDGQPFYNTDKNYLTVGRNGNTPANGLPIIVRELKAYAEDNSTITTNTTVVGAINQLGSTLRLGASSIQMYGSATSFVTPSFGVDSSKVYCYSPLQVSKIQPSYSIGLNLLTDQAPITLNANNNSVNVVATNVNVATSGHINICAKDPDFSSLYGTINIAAGFIGLTCGLSNIGVKISASAGVTVSPIAGVNINFPTAPGSSGTVATVYQTNRSIDFSACIFNSGLVYPIWFNPKQSLNLPFTGRWSLTLRANNGEEASIGRDSTSIYAQGIRFVAGANANDEVELNASTNTMLYQGTSGNSFLSLMRPTTALAPYTLWPITTNARFIAYSASIEAGDNFNSMFYQNIPITIDIPWLYNAIMNLSS